MPVSDDSINLQDAAQVIDLFEQGAEANFKAANRTGSVVDLPDKGSLLVTGDLHDHRENFEKAIKLAELAKSPNNHLVLQELVHGENLVNGMDFSYRILAQSAQLKVQYPEQVHHLLSNHELAQVYGTGILKDSVSVVEAFDEGLAYVFGDETDDVAAAIKRFVKSLALAVRTANGILVAHSLPSPRKMEVFDPEVLSRQLTEHDLTDADGSAHLMIWGRNLTQEQADALGEQWGVRIFLLGHQHADMGYEECGETMLILNSDHDHAVALPVDLSEKEPTRDALAMNTLPLNAVL